MFKPNFTLNSKIVNQLALVERYYGQLIARQTIPSFALRLMQENRVLSTHYSTSIEGNPLTPQEVTNVVLDDQIPINKSEVEVKNYFDLLIYISTMAQKKVMINIDFMLSLHKKLMQNIEIKRPGLLRNNDVIVGHRGPEGLVAKHNPPVHRAIEIRKYLNDVFGWINTQKELHPLIQVAILHHEIAYIHPFYDGNGRIARILTAYFLLLKKYEVTKYFILDDYYDVDRLLYSDKLHSADKGNKTEWIAYFLEGIAYSLKAALSRIEKISDATLERVKGEKRALVTRREEDVLQMIITKKQIKTSDVVKAFDVSRQQAQSLLSSLVDKRLLKKHGKTKSSYYTLRKRVEQQI